MPAPRQTLPRRLPLCTGRPSGRVVARLMPSPKRPANTHTRPRRHADTPHAAPITTTPLPHPVRLTSTSGPRALPAPKCTSAALLSFSSPGSPKISTGRRVGSRAAATTWRGWMTWVAGSGCGCEGWGRGGPACRCSRCSFTTPPQALVLAKQCIPSGCGSSCGDCTAWQQPSSPRPPRGAAPATTPGNPVRPHPLPLPPTHTPSQPLGASPDPGAPACAGAQRTWTRRSRRAWVQAPGMAPARAGGAPPPARSGWGGVWLGD